MFAWTATKPADANVEMVLEVDSIRPLYLGSRSAAAALAEEESSKLPIRPPINSYNLEVMNGLNEQRVGVLSDMHEEKPLPQ